jgi:hypothetical protein
MTTLEIRRVLRHTEVLEVGRRGAEDAVDLPEPACHE